jgi:HTH-type transcriptional regulator/antitoxin MqsA
MVRFRDETFAIEHAGLTAEIEGLSGWRCQACGEIEFDAVSAECYTAPGDTLVMRARERRRADGQRRVMTRPPSR